MSTKSTRRTTAKKILSEMCQLQFGLDKLLRDMGSEDVLLLLEDVAHPGFLLGDTKEYATKLVRDEVRRRMESYDPFPEMRAEEHPDVFGEGAR